MNRVLRDDLGVIWRMLRGIPAGTSHQERLDSFYAVQAGRYDDFRQRLLHGRREMFERLAMEPARTIVELGAGTGYNLQFLGFPVRNCERVDLVDLCGPLLAVARERYYDSPNVHIQLADAATYRPGIPVDYVYLSYALSMMPEWRGVIDNAVSMLRPGGRIGVVDFYISGRRPLPGLVAHGPLTRLFWTRWFAHDGVSLDQAPIEYLQRKTRQISLDAGNGTVPYLPGLKVPYYIYTGTV